MVCKTYVIPTWDMTIGTKDIIRDRAEDSLNEKVSRVLNIPLELLVNRPIISSDLMLNNWHTPKLKDGLWTTWISGIMPDLRWVCIYRITQLSKLPSIAEIRIQVGEADRFIGDLNQLYSIIPLLDKLSEIKDTIWLEAQFGNIQNIRMEAYLPGLITIPQNTEFRIDIKSFYDSKGDNILIGGTVVEPRGLKIAP